jgi:chromosome segregation ATPase
MSDQDSTEESLKRYKEICDELDAECTRLKAEVERLQKESADWQESYHIVNERMSAILKQGGQP